MTVKELKEMLKEYNENDEVVFYLDENQMGEKYVELEVNGEVVVSLNSK